MENVQSNIFYLSSNPLYFCEFKFNIRIGIITVFYLIEFVQESIWKRLYIWNYQTIYIYFYSLTA